jgi:DNA-binding XRE family transcriptional regulator
LAPGLAFSLVQIAQKEMIRRWRKLPPGGDRVPVQNRLKEIRHQLMIDSKSEMARMLGIAWAQYSRYEHQHEQPNLENAFRIAKVLNMRVDDIFYLHD